MMLKKIIPYLAVSVLSVVVAWIYMRLSPPVWWNESLRLWEVTATNKAPKPVFKTHDMKEVQFQIAEGDKCYWISNQGHDFGEPDRKDMEYRKMVVFCPGKGAGWVENNW